MDQFPLASLDLVYQGCSPNTHEPNPFYGSIWSIVVLFAPQPPFNLLLVLDMCLGIPAFYLQRPMRRLFSHDYSLLCLLMRFASIHFTGQCKKNMSNRNKTELSSTKATTRRRVLSMMCLFPRFVHWMSKEASH